jgi:hypothetical protein
VDGVSAINPAAGAAAKAIGMDESAAATAQDWRDACDDAIATMAARGIEFQAADLIEQGLVGEPQHPNQWGPRFAYNARHRVIEPVNAAPSKRATVHASLCRTWRGTNAVRRAA